MIAGAPEIRARLRVLSTFTAQPLRTSMAYWCDRMNIQLPIEFGPVDQVFQELLHPGSSTIANTGINVTLLRLEDVLPQLRKPTSVGGPKNTENEEEYRQSLQELLQCIELYRRQAHAPLLVLVCPPTPALWASLGDLFFAKMEDWLSTQIPHDESVQFVTSQQIAAWYPVADYFDAVAYEEGLIPYSPEMYTALGTTIARSVHMIIFGERYKVIVTDCDNTLWTGICAETEITDLIIDEGRQVLQKALVDQVRRGRLICLCSRNNEEDVWHVFDSHPNMILRREHLAAWKINWQPKHQNLKELGADLNLAPASFVFLEDDPVVCDEVNSLLSDVLTLVVPKESSRLRVFVDHIWAFDKLVGTSEDKLRTTRYREERARQTMRANVSSYEEFLRKLAVDVRINPIVSEDLDRICQLLRRTTQFNSTQMLVSSGELKRLLDRGELCGCAVRVTDRFGDYGLAGCFLYREMESSVLVYVVALSCRILGRGVEHQVFESIRALASRLAKATVRFLYRPTARNKPVATFLNEMNAREQQECEGDITYELFTTAQK